MKKQASSKNSDWIKTARRKKEKACKHLTAKYFSPPTTPPTFLCQNVKCKNVQSKRVSHSSHVCLTRKCSRNLWKPTNHLVYQYEVLKARLTRSTSLSLTIPYAVFAQLFIVRFPSHLGAWNRLLQYLLLPTVAGFQAVFLRLQMQDSSSSQVHSWWVCHTQSGQV